MTAAWPLHSVVASSRDYYYRRPTGATDKSEGATAPPAHKPPMGGPACSQGSNHGYGAHAAAPPASPTPSLRSTLTTTTRCALPRASRLALRLNPIKSTPINQSSHQQTPTPFYLYQHRHHAQYHGASDWARARDRCVRGFYMYMYICVYIRTCWIDSMLPTHTLASTHNPPTHSAVHSGVQELCRLWGVPQQEEKEETGAGARRQRGGGIVDRLTGAFLFSRRQGRSGRSVRSICVVVLPLTPTIYIHS